MPPRKLPATDNDSILRDLKIELADMTIISNLMPVLEASGNLHEYKIHPTQESYKRLIRFARRICRHDPGRPEKQGNRASLDKAVRDRERLRAKAYSRHLARHASRRKSVIELRDRLFGGRTLSAWEADRLVRQAGPALFSIEWFEERQIPLLDHSSFYNGPEFGTDKPVPRNKQKIRFVWGGSKRRDEPGYADLMDFIAKHGVRLVLRGRRVKVAPFAVLGKVHQVAAELANVYGWREDDATLFLLTGKSPPLFAIDFQVIGFRDSYHFGITLRIEPWVSVQSVATAYDWVRRGLCDPMREKDEKQIRLFEFVESFLWRRFGKLYEELSAEELDNIWPTMAGLWNRVATRAKRESWGYDTKRFREAFLRLRPAIAMPPIGPHRRRRRGGP